MIYYDFKWNFGRNGMIGLDGRSGRVWGGPGMREI